MAVLAAVNSATPSLQSTLIRSRIEQARREADQAEAYAQTLRQQADQQERVVQQARGRAQTLAKSAPSSTPPSASPSEDSRASNTDALPVVAEPTYLNTLSEAFRVGKPVLALDLSTTQKNVVKSSLFEAASSTGRLLNTEV